VAVALDQAREGDPGRFDALYRETRLPLVAYCRRLVGPDGDAEGLAQEALVRGWRSWDPDAGRPFWPWAVTVAKHLAIDEQRRAVRRAARAGMAALVTGGQRFPDPEDAALREAEHDALRQALDDLPAPYRTALRLHHVEGRSYQEIADLQRVSVETVRGMLRRARQALRAAYTRLDEVSAVVAVTGTFRRLRLRLDEWAARTQAWLADSGSLFVPAEAVRGAVTLALVIGGGTATMAPERTVAPPPAHVVAVPGQHAGAKAVKATRSSPTVAAPDSAPNDTAAAPRPQSLPLGLSADAVLTPEQVAFGRLTMASRPGTNTAFAVGEAGTDCPAGSCPVLFQSDDVGTSWRRLPATGFRGGTVLLPPAWPLDRRILVLGPNGLQESADGGQTFVTRGPAGQSGAMSPGFSSGDPVVWLGLGAGWVYHDDTKAVTPSELWPPPVADASTYAFAPAWPADNRVLVGGWRVRDDGARSGTVTLCTNKTCRVAVDIPGLAATPDVLVLPSFRRTGVAFAWSGGRMLRSDDTGASFAGVDLPGPGNVSALVAAPDDRLYLALAGVAKDGAKLGGLYVSDDRGASWKRLGTRTRLADGVSAVAVRGDGRLLAAVQGPAGGGLLCSANAGRTWARRC
jgi:RNA polymerase sigma-70 factor (ECF subfamily)